MHKKVPPVCDVAPPPVERDALYRPGPVCVPPEPPWLNAPVPGKLSTPLAAAPPGAPAAPPIVCTLPPPPPAAARSRPVLLVRSSADAPPPLPPARPPSAACAKMTALAASVTETLNAAPAPPTAGYQRVPPPPPPPVRVKVAGAQPLGGATHVAPAAGVPPTDTDKPVPVGSSDWATERGGSSAAAIPKAKLARRDMPPPQCMRAPPRAWRARGKSASMQRVCVLTSFVRLSWRRGPRADIWRRAQLPRNGRLSGRNCRAPRTCCAARSVVACVPPCALPCPLPR